MLKIAFRNCLRNRKRTLLTAMAVFISIWVIVVIVALCDSMITDTLVNTREYSSGEIRVREKLYTEYEEMMPLQYFIPDVDKKIEKIKAIKSVTNAYAHSSIYLSLYHNGTLKTVKSVGVDITSSPFIKGKDVKITAGSMIEKGEKAVLVTSKLLSAYSLEVGDNITLVSKTATGGTNGATFKIKGEVSYNSSDLGGELIVMPIEELSKLSRMEGGALEILIRTDEENLLKTQEEVVKVLSDDSLEVETWHSTAIFYAMLPLYDVMYLVIEILFFFVASTLIFNTLMMSVMERGREISTMVALGFERKKVRFLFILEGFMISLLGAIVGFILSMLTMWIVSITGINIDMLGGAGVSGWGFSKVLYFEVNTPLAIGISLVALIISTFASFLATGRIKKIEVADALREEA